MTTPLDPEAMPAVLKPLLASLHNQESIVASVNDDDCAVLQWHDKLMVVTTDYVNAIPIAIELGIGDSSTIGRLAIAASLADLAGSGATPRCILLSVMMPRDCTTEYYLSLMSGAKAEAEKWGVPIVGGDTKLGRSMAVNATAIGGAASEDELFLKNRARPGDNIWISGCVSMTTAAVLGITQQIGSPEWREWATKVLTLPQIPLERSAALSALQAGCAGTDISDGLGMDLSQMCSLSGVGAILDSTKLPVHDSVSVIASHLNVPQWTLSFGLGGNFQFLVTAKTRYTEDLTNLGFQKIGIVTSEKELLLMDENGVAHSMPETGHRDGRRMSFAEEALQLIKDATRGL
jgi:thiamine-monophosphate kinase